MLVVYDFTNISQFKIIPAKSASKYGECVDFPQFFSQITTIEIFGKKEESWCFPVQTPGEDKHIGCVDVK